MSRRSGGYADATAAFCASYGADPACNDVWVSEPYLEQDAEVYVRGTATDAQEIAAPPHAAALPPGTRTVVTCDCATPGVEAYGA